MFDPENMDSFSWQNRESKKVKMKETELLCTTWKFSVAQH